MRINVQPKATPKQRKLERKHLQRMASKVQSEAHWQQILGSATSAESRAELERVVGPMLSFRRAAPCTTPDCESGKPGVWQPVLVVKSPIDPDTPAWVPIELHLCHDCKQEADLSHFLTDGVWQQVLEKWDSELPPPIKRLTTLQFDRIH